ncbi:MAG: hypothetical protein NTU44_04645 [Bacteroidetes bacterium]|nr:hypothetical protein [Bacteroidota bacterium]
MQKLFDIEELQQQAELTASSGILKDHFLDVHLAKVETLKQLLGAVPNEGEVYFLWTLNSFNAFTFIPYLVKTQGAIQELIITTYSISTRILNALAHYLEKRRIEQVHLVISDSVKFRLPKVQEQLVILCNQRPGQFTVTYAWNHSKITLMKTKNGHFLVEGSGNFSENAQHEQYIFLNNIKIYEFRKASIDELLRGTEKKD